MAVTLPMNINMTNRIVLRLGVVLLLLSGAVASAAIQNLAAKAKIAASGVFSLEYDPKYLADEKIPQKDCHDDVRQAWCLPQTVANGATLTFEWPGPVTIAEVVYWGVRRGATMRISRRSKSSPAMI